ncbi:MAG: hypothetical protein JXQ72_14860 [Anaerolineae bacterium]|nr:hypothetical protein [Anaerolineae bacterium]
MNTLVTYTTLSGSTVEVAEAIGKQLEAGGAAVTVRPLADAGDLSAYDAVIIGAPMVLGWHRDAVKFVVANQSTLSQKTVAYFMTCYSLTAIDGDTVNGVPVFLDPQRAAPVKTPGKLSMHEKFSLASAYLGPVLKKAPAIKPVSVGFFGGKVDYSSLNLFHKLFLRLIIRAQAGDFRNWDAIKAWAGGLLAE